MLCDSIVKKMFDFKYFQYFEIVLKIRKKGGKKKFKNVIPLSISFFERKFFPGFISKPLFTFNFMIRYKKFHSIRKKNYTIDRNYIKSSHVQRIHRNVRITPKTDK